MTRIHTSSERLKVSMRVSVLLAAVAALSSITHAESHATSQQSSDAAAAALSPRAHLQEFTAKCQYSLESISNSKQQQAETTTKNFNRTRGGSETTSSSECSREPTAWRWLYAQENTPEAPRILVKDSSIDERLANVQYTINSGRINYNDAFKFDSGDAALDAQHEQLVAGARVDDQLCGQHLSEMLAQIEQLEQELARAREDTKHSLDLDEKFLYLAKVLDSFGRYDSGHLSGRSFSVGAYDQCLEARLALNTSTSTGESGARQLTSTRFCWARMTSRASLDEALRLRNPNVELQDQVLSSGICIPATCHTRNFKQYRHLFERLVASQFKLPSSLYARQNLDLESIFCLADEDSPYLSKLPLSGKLFLLVAFTWFSLIIYASCRNATPGQVTTASSHPVLKCLDIKQSWLEFTEQQQQQQQRQQQEEEQERDQQQQQQQEKRQVNLKPLNLVKVLMCAYVVMGHSAMAHFFNAQNQLRTSLQNEIDPISTAVLIGTFSVDTFLVITGILLAFMLLKRMDHKSDVVRKTTTPPKSALGATTSYLKLFAGVVSMRYIRLVPLYFLVSWFKKSLFARLGSGPFWDLGFNRQTSLGACEHSESWLTPLKLDSCYLSLFRQCLTPTWSISLDFQLCALVLPAVLLAHRHRRCAKLLLASAWLYCAYLGYHVITKVIEPEILQELVDCKCHGVGQFFNKYSIMYTSPKLRFCCMAIGALAGILLYEYEKNQKRKSSQSVAASSPKQEPQTRWPKVIEGPLTVFAISWQIFFFVTLTNTQWLQQQIAPYHTYFLYNVVGLRALWSFSNAIIFLRMTTDWKDSLLMQLNSIKLWKILAKLNLVILLIHWDMILFYQNFQIDTYNLRKFNWFMTFGAVYFFSLLLGTLLHVTVENPLNHLIGRYLLSDGSSSKKVAAKHNGVVEVQEQVKLSANREKLE